MAFGQQSGPPASAKQMHELQSLLNEAGHSDFRDARGPMGFTQRQAAGKFTRDEAAAFIDLLHCTTPDQNTPGTARPAPAPAAVDDTMAAIPAEQLAAELRRRGWTVTEP